jgi:hypothetical protein
MDILASVLSPVPRGHHAPDTWPDLRDIRTCEPSFIAAGLYPSTTPQVQAWRFCWPSAESKTAWQRRTRSRWDIAVDQRADRTFMSTGQGLWPSATPGRVQVLDGRTGRRLRTVHSGALPSVPETTSLRTNGTEAEQQRLTAFLQRRLPDSPLAPAGTWGVAKGGHMIE